MSSPRTSNHNLGMSLLCRSWGLSAQPFTANRQGSRGPLRLGMPSSHSAGGPWQLLCSAHGASGPRLGRKCSGALHTTCEVPFKEPGDLGGATMCTRRGLLLCVNLKRTATCWSACVASHKSQCSGKCKVITSSRPKTEARDARLLCLRQYSQKGVPACRLTGASG